jgi:hypothetical protein
MSLKYDVPTNSVTNATSIALSSEADRIYAELNLESDKENQNSSKPDDSQAELVREL